MKTSRATRVGPHSVPHRVRQRALLEALEPRTFLTTTLVSSTPAGTIAAGGAGVNINPATRQIFSPDGRFVLFTSSAASVVAGVTDTNNTADLFLRDLQTNTTVMISANAAGQAVGSTALSGTLFSPDSKYLIFLTGTANMVAGVTDTNAVADLFARDLQTGVTSVISAAAAGNSTANGVTQAPVFSPDGKLLAFSSPAGNLVAGVTDTGGFDVFVHTMATGNTSVVSINPAGTAAVGNSSVSPVFSPDGRYIAFTSSSPGLAAGVTDDNGSTDLFVRDLQTGVTTLVTRDLANQAAGFAVSGNAFSYQFTADSHTLVYSSFGTGIVAGVADANNANDLFAWDAQNNTIRMLTVTANGESAGDKVSTPIALSPDGRYVAFTTASTNLTPASAGGDVKADLYVRDLLTDTTSYVAVNASSSVAFPLARFSPDGVHLLFQSDATNVVPGLADTNGKPDLFLYNLQTGAVSAVTINLAGTATGNAQTFSVDDPIFSPDGRYLSFVSDATDLTASPADHLSRYLFLRDLQAGTTTLVTAGLNGAAVGYDQAATRDAEFTPDNRFLLYIDNTLIATPLIATPLTTPFNFNFAQNLYAFDTVTHAQHLLSTNAAGTAYAAGGVEPFTFAINPAGGTVMFVSSAPDMVAGVTDIPAGSANSYDAFLRTLPSVNGPTAPQATVTGKGAAIAAGDATPATADGSDFGTTPVGAPVSHTFTVTNTGTAALAVGNLTVPAGFTVTETLSASLDPGASDSFTVRFDAAAAGTFGGTVAFSTNDPAAATFQFAITATAGGDAGPAPNLVIEGGVTQVKVGTFVGGAAGGRASVKVFNRGTATAAGPLRVTFYASADGTVDAGDTPLVTVSKNGTLKANKSLVFTGTFKYPLGIPDGAYQILAKVDPADTLAESDEADNTAAAPGTITLAAPFVDLSGVFKSIGKLKAGKSATATLTLQNNGNVKTSGKITLQAVLSADDVLGNGDDIQIAATVKSIAIVAQKTQPATLTLKLTGVAAGTYHLFALIDTTNAVPESDELNNSVVAPSIVTVT
jgi:Tol biopolymer transport system component